MDLLKALAKFMWTVATFPAALASNVLGISFWICVIIEAIIILLGWYFASQK